MKNIAVVCGGYSKEEVISIQSAEQIMEAIDKTKYKVFSVIISKDSWSVKTESGLIPIDKNDFSFSNDDIKIVFDAVFMAIHGTPGEDGKLQSYFEMLNIPVTTSNSFVSALTFNKYACKAFLQNFGVLSANAYLLRKGEKYEADDIEEEVGLPMFVKPNSGGSSFGVTKVKRSEDIIPAIEKAFAEDDEIIIEEFIEGGEFTCGVFCSENENIVLPLTEIVSKTEFFDFEAKYKGLSDEITPARLDNDQTNECQELSYDIYKLLNCSGIVRIDYLLRDDQFYFMEANTVPGMSKESIVPQQVRAYGMSVTEFYTLLIEDAISRLGEGLI
ncbi:MAG: D-alanine--D-alanine ligase [Salinivirgaceae bacterium]|nr:D-alanine--D-alanine ligase [Salinivirgaceae bacterium]